MAGFVLLVATSAFWVATLIAELRARDFSAASNFISDLGAIPETAAFFNTALIVTGLLVLVAGALLRRVLAKPFVTVSFVVAGIACALIGVIPLNLAKSAHEIVALIALASLNALPAVTSAVFNGWLRLVPIALSIAGLALLAVLTLGYVGALETSSWVTLGGVERLTVYPALVWLLVFSGYLIARGSGRQGLS